MEYRLAADVPARRPTAVLAAELEQTRARLRRLVEQIRIENPERLPVELTLIDILSLPEAESALVAPLITNQGTAIFIVPPGVCRLEEKHIVRLDHWTEDDLIRLLVGDGNQPGWLPTQGGAVPMPYGGPASTAIVENVAHRLWENFISAVCQRLRELDIRRVVLLPQGGLQLLPLHAAWHEADGCRCYFIDDFELSYAPSAYAFHFARQQSRRSFNRSAFIAGVSAYKSLTNLPNVEREVKAVAAHFGTSPLLNEAVTPQSVLEMAPTAAYIHLACHGMFAWQGDPLSSSLCLAGDERLTLSDIMGRLNLTAARLVILSACESGVTNLRKAPDEFLGLPAGFIQAGATGVVSSLWAVDDRSTALLMERFYSNHLEKNMRPAEALRDAQQWLRHLTTDEMGDYLISSGRMSESEYQAVMNELLGSTSAGHTMTPYQSPYYWAPFTFNGV
jgi:CHAT domain-containing protein